MLNMKEWNFLQQKIVIRVPLKNNEKKKSKAMKIAVTVRGVSAVGIGMEDDELVVMGEGIDSVHLVKCLRKKFQFADIKSIEEAMTQWELHESHGPYPPGPPLSPLLSPWPSYPISPYQPYIYQTPVYDSGPSNCSVM